MNGRALGLLPHAGLVALVAVFFAEALLPGRVLFYRDLGMAAHPVLSEARQAADGGVDPLPSWTHALSGGKPLLADPGNSLLHPLNVLYLLLPFNTAFDLFIVVHVALAGMLMACLARRLGASPCATFVAGCAYALGGYVVSATNLYPTLAAAAWAPLTLALGLAAAREPTATRIAGAALALAVQALGGQPEPVLLTVLSGVALSLAAGWRTDGLQRPVRAALAWAATCAWALLLAAPQVLPAALLSARSVRGLGFSAEGMLYNSVRPSRLAWMVVPLAQGNPMRRLAGEYPQGILTDTGTPYLLSLYAGATVVLLAAVAVRRGRTGGSGDETMPPLRDRRLILTLLGLVALGAVGSVGRFLPGAVEAARLVEGLHPFRYPEKLLFLAFLALPLLAASGADAVRERWSLRPLGLLICVVVALDLLAAHRAFVPTIEAAALREPPLARELRERSRALGHEDGTWRTWHQRPAWWPRLQAHERTEQRLYLWQRRLLVPPTGAPFGILAAFERSPDQLGDAAQAAATRELAVATGRRRAAILGASSVLWVVARDGSLEDEWLVREKDLGPADGLPPGSGTLYRNTLFRPRVTAAPGRARLARADHAGLEVEVEGASRCVVRLSDRVAAGWRVEARPREAAAETPGGGVADVLVTPPATLRYSYATPGLRLGLALAAAGAALAVAAFLRASRRPSSRHRPGR